MTQLNIYRIPASWYAREHLKKRCTAPAILIGLSITVFFIYGFGDVRWWLLGLMLIFNLIPLALALGWIIVSGHKDMGTLLRPCSIEVDNDELIIKFYHYDIMDNENQEPISFVSLKPNDIKSVYWQNKYLKIYSNDKTKFEFILIPLEALPSPTFFDKY